MEGSSKNDGKGKSKNAGSGNTVIQNTGNTQNSATIFSNPNLKESKIGFYLLIK